MSIAFTGTQHLLGSPTATAPALAMSMHVTTTGGQARKFMVIGNSGSASNYFGMLTDRAEIALRLTVTLDLVKQVKFSNCARIECGQPFPESRRDKQFCSRECAHVEAVRRSRNKIRSNSREQEALRNGKGL